MPQPLSGWKNNPSLLLVCARVARCAVSQRRTEVTPKPTRPHELARRDTGVIGRGCVGIAARATGVSNHQSLSGIVLAPPTRRKTPGARLRLNREVAHFAEGAHLERASALTGLYRGARRRVMQLGALLWRWRTFATDGTADAAANVGKRVRWTCLSLGCHAFSNAGSIFARPRLQSGQVPSLATADSWRRTLPTPSKKELSKAGKDLQNPRTSERRETQAAKTLRKGQTKKK
jgi:hypothetical protein